MWRLIVVTFGFLGFAFYEVSGGADYAPVAHSIQARDAGAPLPERVAGVQASTVPPTLATAPVEARASTAPEPAPAGASVGSAGAIAAVTSVAPQDEPLTEARAEGFEISLAAYSTAGVPTLGLAPSGQGISATRDSRAIDAAVESALGSDPEEPVFSLESYVAAALDSGAAPLFDVSAPAPALGSAAVPDAASGSTLDMREVTGSSVNMRSGPGTDFRKLASLTQGTPVVVLDAPGNGWLMLEVAATGEVGWMADWLVSAAD